MKKLAISSVRKDGNHYFLADFDEGLPTVRKSEWVIKTREKHYHVLDFSSSLSLEAYVLHLCARGADPCFIRTVNKHKFGQLTIHGEVLQQGFFPDKLHVRLVEYVE